MELKLNLFKADLSFEIFANKYFSLQFYLRIKTF